MENIYQSKLFEETKKELQKIDKTDLLGNRLNFLSNVLSIVKSKNYNYSDIKLIECGTCPLFMDRNYQPSVSYFFANYPEFIDYKGYDSEIYAGHEKAIQEQMELNKDKFILSSKNVFNNFKKQQIEGEFWNLVRETHTNKKLIIISNYVLGVAQEHAPFWNLPGLHAHQFLFGDFEPYSILDSEGKHKFVFDNLNKYYSKLEDRLKAIYKINDNAKALNVQGRNIDECLVVYEN